MKTVLNEHQDIEIKSENCVGHYIKAGSDLNTYYKATPALLNGTYPSSNRPELSVNNPDLTVNELELSSNTKELPQFLQEITEKGKTWLKHEGKS